MPAGINKSDSLGLRRQVTESLWFVPGLCVVAALVLGITLAELDSRYSSDYFTFAFRDNVEAARTVLSTIAGAMVTVTALVFSVTMLVLQLASAQFTPRVVRNFLGDRSSQLALGLFAATFTYSLTVLARINSASEGADEVTPSLSMLGAFILVLMSIGVFVHFVDHIAQSIRVTTIVDRIAKDTQESMKDLYPHDVGAEADTPPLRLDELGPVAATVDAAGSGVIAAVNAEGLLAIAKRTQTLISLPYKVGEFVPLNAELLHFHGQAEVSQDDMEEARSAVRFSRERSVEQDASFGIRQLVDIALRALSPGINDPTTASQAIYRVHSLLRFVGTREFPDELRIDEETGAYRLALPRPSWEDYVNLAFEELRHYGKDAPQTVFYLRKTLDDLIDVVPPHRQRALRQQKRLLEDAVSPAEGSVPVASG